jgi:hypothetical protein
MRAHNTLLHMHTPTTPSLLSLSLLHEFEAGRMSRLVCENKLDRKGLVAGGGASVSHAVLFGSRHSVYMKSN